MKKLIVSLMSIFAFILTACGGDEVNNNSNKSTNIKVITVAASPTPHAEILNNVKDNLLKKGIELKIVTFDDYVQPNIVVDQGSDIIANYTQHEPYLKSFNKEKGTHLVVAGKIHYEPFGIYPGISKSFDDLNPSSSIAIPNDTTNEARALLLLQDNGLIKLKDGAGLTATILDIVENKKNIKLVELDAAQIARVKNEFDMVVLNGNYALNAGFNVNRDAIAYEKSNSEAAKTYVNIIAVKQGNENNSLVKSLVEELRSESTKQFIKDKYSGAVVFYDEQ
jgi:D-methionine transport system substrate-binding protein